MRRPLALHRYPIAVRISAEATSEDEAKVLIERLLAGRFDFEFIALDDDEESSR